MSMLTCPCHHMHVRTYVHGCIRDCVFDDVGQKEKGKMERVRNGRGRFHDTYDDMLASGVAVTIKCRALRHTTDDRYVCTNDISMTPDNHSTFITHSYTVRTLNSMQYANGLRPPPPAPLLRSTSPACPAGDDARTSPLWLPIQQNHQPTN